MKKKFMLLFLLMAFFQAALRADPEKTKFYVSTNIFSPFAAVNPSAKNIDDLLFTTVYKTAAGIASDFEFGLNLNLGWRLSRNHTLETRFSTGCADPINYLTQLHEGYIYTFGSTRWYAGGFVKFWDVWNTATELHFFHTVLYFAGGYAYPISERFFIDFRIEQSVAVYSFSSVPHSSPGGDFFFSHVPTLIPFHPCASICLAYNF